MNLASQARPVRNLALRVDADLLSAVDEIAAHSGCDRSTACRDLIALGVHFRSAVTALAASEDPEHSVLTCSQRLSILRDVKPATPIEIRRGPDGLYADARRSALKAKLGIATRSEP